MLYLSQIYAALNEPERRRIERQFGVLLRHSERSQHTCRSIVASIRRNFKLNQCSWISILLKKGNPIEFDSLSLDEKLQVEQSPLLIMDGLVHLPAEFIEAWKFEPKLAGNVQTNMPIIEESRNGLFLFSALHRLKLRERQAYMSWLKRYTDPIVIDKLPYQSVTMRLYLMIRTLRTLPEECTDSNSLEGTGPWPLDDIFAELWHNPPFYWYQKELVPFYQCLQGLEKEIFRKSKNVPSSPNSIEKIKTVYYGLRTGKFCVVEEEQGFGKKLKPMLYRTIDFQINPAEINNQDVPVQQDLLF